MRENMDKKKVVEEILAIDAKLWNQFMEPGDVNYPENQMDNPWYAVEDWMASTVELLFMKGIPQNEIETALNAYTTYFASGDTRAVINECLDFGRIKQKADVRSDWANALRNVKRGTDLSQIIGWVFSDKDISELARLHKANKFRRKIEDLLEDCNFHYENECFSAGKYDEFLIAS